jgi:hypothetical protein
MPQHCRQFKRISTVRRGFGGHSLAYFKLLQSSERLSFLLHQSDDLAIAFSTLKEHHVEGHLDSSSIFEFKKRHGMKGTANSITHEHFDDEIAVAKAFFQNRCTECGVDITLFAAGMWYLGANALTILVDDFLKTFDIPAGE